MKFECSCCKNTYLGTEDHFYRGCIETAKEKGRNYIPKCKVCGRNYQLEYRNNLRAKGLSTRGLPLPRRRVGTIYVIGTDDRSIPCKVGMTIGKDISRRLSSIQVGNWAKLKVLYKSPLVENIDEVEAGILNSLKKKRVRGEWHLLSKNDIENFEKLLVA